MVPKLVPKIPNFNKWYVILSLFFIGVMSKQTPRKLTDSKLRNIAAGSKQITSSAVAGLIFIPSTSTKGQGAWILRYYNNKIKKRQKVTVGHYPAMSIVEAEAEANRLKFDLKNGIDPKRNIQIAKESKLCQEDNTFLTVATEFFTNAQNIGKWKNSKNVQNWINRMGKYIYPKIGHLDITEIRAQDISEALQNIWRTKPETATKTLLQIRQVFQRAEALGRCNHNPCIAAKTILGSQKLLPMEERRFPSLYWQDIPQFFKQVFENKKLYTGRYTLMFLILNACRSGAVRFVDWSDIDLTSAVWALKPERENSKTSVVRFYPLSTQALRILKYHKTKYEVISGIKQRSYKKPSVGADLGLVFRSKNNTAFSDMTLTGILRRHATEFKSDAYNRLITVHGFRSTFKGWAVSHNYDDRLSELQLCHNYGTAVQRAYDRQPLIEERRAMMQAWADYCFSEITDFDSLFEMS